jgi:hypothetical protein
VAKPTCGAPASSNRPMEPTCGAAASSNWPMKPPRGATTSSNEAGAAGKPGGGAAGKSG